MTHPMKRLFNLFELDRLNNTKEQVEAEKLAELAGLREKINPLFAFRNVEKEYSHYKGLLYPERMYRIRGEDFIVDVFDEGNGWYQVVRFKIIGRNWI